MKKLLIVPVLLFIMIKSSGQTLDSLTKVNKNHMNNIQTSVFGFGGYFGLQYERAINKDWSLSLIGSFDYPFSQLTKESSSNTNYTEKYNIQAEVRYYLDKNTINNNGLYISGDIGYIYKIQYVPDQRHSAYAEKKYPWLGASIGYQFFIKNRLVIDAGIALQYGFKGQMYYSSSSYLGWEKMTMRESFLPITLNIGYAF